MARASLLHLVRSQARAYRSGYHFAAVVPHVPHAKLDVNSPLKFALAQRQWSSRADDDNRISIGPRKRSEDEIEEKDSGIVYHGPISNTIKTVKLLSLSTCCLSVSLGPVITFMTFPEMDVILKGAFASSIIFLSASTTAALHWFVNPYIHKLRWHPGSDSFEVEMMSWLATYLPKTINFADIRPPETKRPYVSFKANGNLYFIDAQHCHNKALLAKLTLKNDTSSRTCNRLQL